MADSNVTPAVRRGFVVPDAEEIRQIVNPVNGIYQATLSDDAETVREKLKILVKETGTGSLLRARGSKYMIPCSNTTCF